MKIECRTNRRGPARRRAIARGFTFIEIMVVVMIIGILMAVVVPRLIGQGQQARITSTRATMQSVATALSSFEVRAGRFPTTDEGLEALVTKPESLNEDEWAGPYLDDTPLDAWKQEMVYRSPGEKNRDYDLISKGPDKQDGTADDVTNEKRRRPRDTAQAE